MGVPGPHRQDQKALSQVAQSRVQWALGIDVGGQSGSEAWEFTVTHLKTVAKGAMIGIANIIPGVSGGTVALMLGIYERILQAIDHLSPNTARALFGLLAGTAQSRARFRTEMERIDAVFLVFLALGTVLAIVLSAELITFLLDAHREPTYGFFFGLVLVSAWTPFSLIKKKTALCAGMVALGAIGVISIASAISQDTLIDRAKAHTEQGFSDLGTASDSAHRGEPSSAVPLHLLYIFGLGFIAISAMILPGVSGSFVLLLLGGYFTILRAISERDIGILTVFLLGCGVGLIAFSRFINFLLKRWHDLTMGVLLGLVLGSLWMLWPFKATQQMGSETVSLHNLFPDSWAANEWWTLAAAVLGGLVVVCLIWFEVRGSQPTTTRRNAA